MRRLKSALTRPPGSAVAITQESERHDPIANGLAVVLGAVGPFLLTPAYAETIDLMCSNNDGAGVGKYLSIAAVWPSGTVTRIAETLLDRMLWWLYLRHASGTINAIL